MWDYIKANNLQNPKNKRKILLDEKLSTLFKSPLDMFTMNSQLSRHVYTLGKLPAPMMLLMSHTSSQIWQSAPSSKLWFMSFFTLTCW